MQALFSRAFFSTLTAFVFGAATGCIAMYLWLPSFQISFLAGVLPGACCGFLSILIAFDSFEMPSFVERGFA
jgi:hypothetical protein